MPLTPGSRIGTYEIIATLGAGGMGAVYRARDVKLGRAVALKVILDTFASDNERIARFEREAKMLAALNHPRIAGLYGMEHADGQHFLVMELVEGETLAERLHRGPMNVEDAIAVGLQIAEALEAAHEKGVIHRDLKPANVKITPDQQVKVLDFGLAKAVENEGASADMANSPTLSMMATQAGVILGTAAYMSPEQAKGFPADHRSDVFSFGTVLFEMLTGRQPFQGDTAPEILASVLVREPEIHHLPSDANPRLIELVKRCLEKSPKRRWQHIGDVRAEMETLTAAPRSIVMHAQPQRQPVWKRVLVPTAIAVMAAAMAGTAAWTYRTEPEARIARFSIVLPENQGWTYLGRSLVDVSPDGRRFAYVAGNRLYVRDLDRVAAEPVPGLTDTELITSPTFSPDGAFIAFHTGGAQHAIRRVPVRGGTPITIVSAPNPLGMSWADDGRLYYATGQEGIMRVSGNGGAPEQILAPGAEERFYRPVLLPDGDTLIFSVATGIASDRWDRGNVVALSMKSRERRVLLTGASDARLLPNGYLAYAVQGVVHAVPFDAAKGEITGTAVPILEGVLRSPGAASASSLYAVSHDGTLVYVPGPVSVDRGGDVFVIADREGAATPLPLAGGAYQAVRASRDGRQIVFEVAEGAATAIYIYNVDGRTAMRRLTVGSHGRGPIFTPKGDRVTFSSDREGDAALYWIRADGTGGLERLTKPGSGVQHAAEAWSADGRTLLYSEGRNGIWTLHTLTLPDRVTAPFSDTPARGPFGAVFSPDGKWVAYGAPAGATYTIFVEPFPSTGAKYELPRRSNDDPHHPVFSPDGKTMHYTVRPGAMESVSILTSPVFSFGNPAPLIRRFRTQSPMALRYYDMLPDGRFVGQLAPGQSADPAATRSEIQIVLNWFEELKDRFRQ